MVGKSGAARIALETGCPVIPVGQWGAHDLLYPYAQEAPSVPAHADHDEGRRPGATRRPAGQAAHGRGDQRGDRAGSWPRSPTWWPSSGTRSLRRSGSTHAGRDFVRPATRSRRSDGEAGDHGEEVEGRMTQVSVLGAGSWGTAFSLVLADAGNDVTLWARREEVCDTINQRRENTDYLPGVELPPTIVGDPRHREGAWRPPTSSCSPYRRRRSAPNLEQWAPHIPASAVMVSLMKGVELGTLKRMSEVVAEVTGAGPERIAVVSGPNLSHEIAQREPAASVVASADEEIAQQVQQLVHGPAFRPYTSVDVVGCELGGAYKNVVALSVGHGRRARFRRQHDGFGDHPRPGRDRPAGDGDGRQPAHPDGTRRSRRPGGDVLVAAVAQPDLRREARPRHDHRGDRGVDPSGRRGREVVLVAAGTGRTRSASTRRSPSTSKPSSTDG